MNDKKDSILIPKINNDFEIVTESKVIKEDALNGISFKNTGSDTVIINNVISLAPGDPMISFGADLPAWDMTPYRIVFLSNTDPKLEVVRTTIIGYIRVLIEEPLVVSAIKK